MAHLVLADDHLVRIDARPNSENTISGKYQTWYTKSVGYGVADAGLLVPAVARRRWNRPATGMPAIRGKTRGES